MKEAMPSLAGAEWLRKGAVRRIFDLLDTAGEEARVVGGAVRNALMGLPIPDFDIGTTALPERVLALADAAGLRAVPTGIEHGTVTIVVDGRGFEVTTLREDVETDGRHAVVRFGRDWTADALRRDFTMNALSVDAAGVVHDPAGGYPDLLARRVRFIGEADTRIAEDRLRILRLFRFHARYGEGPIDPVGLSASIRARAALRDLSAERIGQEMRKLVVARRAAEVVAAMQDAGILPIVLGGIGYPVDFARLPGFEAAAEAKPTAPMRLAVLACRIAEDVARLTERLRLSNAERDRMAALVSSAGSFARAPQGREARRLLYAHGVDVYRDAIAAGIARHGGEPGPWLAAFRVADRWPVPKFPLDGHDVMDSGARGRAVGELMRTLEAWWIEQDFAPDERALRTRLQQMMAAAQ